MFSSQLALRSVDGITTRINSVAAQQLQNPNYSAGDQGGPGLRGQCGPTSGVVAARMGRAR